ncbi:MAG: hypothetical protein ACREQQ_09955, partial [Candidatus Binatia bacterium]
VILLLAVAMISASGLLARSAAGLGGSRLSGAPREYLRRSSEQSVRFLVVLSAAKTALAIVEGSSANVSLVFFGASVQVGDVVKALYDALDYAWTAVLFGCAVLFALGFLLEGCFHVGQYTLALAALALAVKMGFERFSVPRIISDRLFRFFLSLTLAVWVAFPLALVAASAASVAITAQPLEQAEEEVTSLQRSVAPSAGSALGVRDAIERTKMYLVAKTDDVTRALGTIIAGYVLDCVVFPSLFSMLLLGLVKRLVGLT